MKPLYMSDELWEEIKEIASQGRCEKCGGLLNSWWTLHDGIVICQKCSETDA